jgi:hypothetical protein
MEKTNYEILKESLLSDPEIAVNPRFFIRKI